MSDWIATLITTPYTVVPLLAWLWSIAKLPKVKWGRIAGGAMLVFAGTMLNAFGAAIAAYPWAASVMPVINGLAVIINAVGLLAIVLYAFAEALALFK